MPYEDQQEVFYAKELAALKGKKIHRAGLTKSGAGIFIETEDKQIVIFSRIGENVYPVDMQIRPRQVPPKSRG